MGILESLKVKELSDYNLYSWSQALEAAMNRIWNIDFLSKDEKAAYNSICSKFIEVKSEIRNRDWGEMLKIALKEEFELERETLSRYLSYLSMGYVRFCD